MRFQVTYSEITKLSKLLIHIWSNSTSWWKFPVGEIIYLNGNTSFHVLLAKAGIQCSVVHFLCGGIWLDYGCCILFIYHQ